MKIVFTMFLMVMFFMVYKVGYYSLVLHKQYTHLSASQRLKTYMYNSNRGDILDRNLKPLTDRDSEIVIVYSPNKENGDVKEVLVAEPYSETIDLIEGSYVVERTTRNCGVAEHLIGNVGYARFPKLYGLRGLSGLEKQYDDKLAGVPARVALIADSMGRPMMGIPPYNIEGDKNKNSLVLTIDADIQESLEYVIDTKNLIERGAVIVMDPYNGEVIAMVSRPSMNFLNIDDGSHLNKAIQINKGFHPASVFKIAIGLYALENGHSPNTSYTCKDMCIYPHGHITFREGIAKSCNEVFYQMVLQYGPEAILDYAKGLGFGEKTGIDLNGESNGMLPEIDTVKGAQGNRLLAMGQGQLEVTPLQIAKLTAMVANGGYEVTPKVVGYLGKKPNKLYGFRNLGPRALSKESATQMQGMMELTTKIGTAKALDGFGAVKTGTGDNKNRWMTGYFPQENPQYVVTIFVEEGYGQSITSVTKEIIKTIFN